MKEHEYETLFNEILVKTRERRRELKESLDKCFDDDPTRSTDVLADMLKVNQRHAAVEGNRPAFLAVMAAMREIRTTREEVLERIDRLMEQVRRFLALKEELAEDKLDRLTQLFREETTNPDFKFHFDLLDDQELHHLSELRSLSRGLGAGGSPSPSAIRSTPPVEDSREAEPTPAPSAWEGAGWTDTTSSTAGSESRSSSWGEATGQSAASDTDEVYDTPSVAPAAALAALAELNRDDDPAPLSGHTTSMGLELESEAADTDRASRVEASSWLDEDAGLTDGLGDDLGSAAGRTISEADYPMDDADAKIPGTGYEVDVDVLRIMSEETFKPDRR